MRLKKILLVVALTVAIALPLAAYASIKMDEGAWVGKNQEAPSDVTKFRANVNGMRDVDVFVCVNISDGLTGKEAELIVGTTFILVMGDYVRIDWIP